MCLVVVAKVGNVPAAASTQTKRPSKYGAESIGGKGVIEQHGKHGVSSNNSEDAGAYVTTNHTQPATSGSS